MTRLLQSWELSQADVLQHVRGVEKQQLGVNVTVPQAQSLQPSSAKGLTVVEFGTQDWKDFLHHQTGISNYHRHPSQAVGIVGPYLKHSPLPSFNFIKFNPLHQQTTREVLISHSPDESLPVFKPSTSFN